MNAQLAPLTVPTCPYCWKCSVLVDGRAIYPGRPDLRQKLFWACVSCEAWVGCHPGTKAALGRLANASLRKLKHEVHEVFDPHWISAPDRKAARTRAYARLAQEMGLPPEQCHIGMFDEERCRAALAVVNQWNASQT